MPWDTRGTLLCTRLVSRVFKLYGAASLPPLSHIFIGVVCFLTIIGRTLLDSGVQRDVNLYLRVLICTRLSPSSSGEQFVRFVNHVMNDMTYLLDEAMRLLGLIRDIELLKKNAAQWAALNPVCWAVQRFMVFCQSSHAYREPDNPKTSM